MTNAHPFDILIAGGGLTGGLAALALANSGFRIGLAEGLATDRMVDPSFDGRTTAIAYANMRLIRRLGLWPAITDHAEPIQDILVTDGHRRTRFRDGAVSPFHLHFDSRMLGAADEDGSPLGWIVENAPFRAALFQRLLDDDRVTIFAPATISDTRFEDAGARLVLKDGSVLRTPLLLAAAGKGSAIRSRAGIKATRYGYGQQGLIVAVSHARAHGGFAQEYFLPGGPFAILPMTDTPDGSSHLPHRSSLVWTERDREAEALKQLDDDGFLEELRLRFGDYLGEIALAGPRASYPLSFTLSHAFVAPRLALIGDAARAIHPIAGQGFNLAIKDIAALVDVLSEAKRVGIDIGAMTVLDDYQSWRRFDSAMLALGTDALNRLFSTDLSVIRRIRDIGIGAVNAIAPARRFFMRQAGADVGELPSLLKPDSDLAA